MTPAEALASAIDEIDSGPSMRGVHADHAPRILAALAAAGFVVVPEKPSVEMQDAAHKATLVHLDDITHIWFAMLAARPR